MPLKLLLKNSPNHQLFQVMVIQQENYMKSEIKKDMIMLEIS